MLLTCSLLAQQRTDEEAVRVVADNILKQPVTQFVGVSNGVVYNSTAEIPKGEDVKFKSPLTEVDLIEAMPADHPNRAELLTILKKQIVGASRWQNGNGMWNQLLDKCDSYDESSVTAMFVYGVAKAINNGWIDSSYRNIARAGWSALKNNEITPDGRFTNVCVGTGISEDLPFYFNRPVGDNEKHGLGLIINTAVEIMKLESEKK
ncbi:MAG: hypothetical protein A2W86_01140 [Bacteroidetes bacterium GWD2_45_23]|nr:MAG: hypothetical protein A2W87_11075 [Bacteroidetes bacterium GWC2_46_850]OFX74276.1 MAG: hypothetical protein A2071_04010 [Bacteroidetes bacterium GWC1_47_7]OFX84096.1 MAG: hypothetical protein A2W86_01140 [Bacteroidetes bacterium GWD2_45_23]